MVVCWHSICVRGDTICKVLSNRIWICPAQHFALSVCCTERTHSICFYLDYQTILFCLCLVSVAVCCTNFLADYLHRNYLQKSLYFSCVSALLPELFHLREGVKEPCETSAIVFIKESVKVFFVLRTCVRVFAPVCEIPLHLLDLEVLEYV